MGQAEDPGALKPNRIVSNWPAALAPLMEGYGPAGRDPAVRRKRYYVAHGGRGSAKSWTFARALLVMGLYDPLRILCAREIMKTLKESVHQLLVDQIEALGLGYWYSATETGIKGANGTEFMFAGLRTLDAQKIKSYEGVDIAWIEEAHSVSKRSWNILIPTIRAEGSEIWVTFNPELDTDETYDRFVLDTEIESAWVARVNWRDNPWFPEVLEQERLTLKRKDPDEYDHVWEGNPRSVVEGAIYAKEVTKMVHERRYGAVPYDPALPVHRIWDLGWNDAMAIIFVQKTISAASVIGYRQDSFKTYAQWIKEFNEMDYVWGQDWIPHDGGHKEPRTGKSVKQWLEGLRCKHVNLIPKLGVEDGIRAARMLFQRSYIDRRNATDLMMCLKRYRRAVPETTGEPGRPVHDEYSHGADAYRGLAVCIDKIRNELDERPRLKIVEHRPLDPNIGM